MKTKHKVSCVIAAFNERERVGKVVEAAKKCELIDEIIVVDDGSTDGTGEVLRGIEGIKVIELGKNRGKAYAISRGIKAAKQQIIALVDSDITGLTAANLKRLIAPVIEDENLVTMSVRKNSLLPYRILKMDFVTGERVFNRKYYEALGDVSKEGYAFEIIMNKYLLENHVKIMSVVWENVFHPMKMKKRGFIAGVIGDAKMIAQLHKYERADKIVWQFLQMAYVANYE